MPRVQSIERAFAVLGALVDGPIGVTDVAGLVDLPKSTVARLLGSLAREGAVEQVPGESRYRLGERLVSLTAGVRTGHSLISTARPYLVELARLTGEAAGLSVPDGSMMHYIDQIESAKPVQVRDWTGTRIPVHAVSSGQVVLANLSPAELDVALATPLERFTSRTLVDVKALRARLHDVQRDGFAWAREEYAEGITSIAAPIAGRNGEVVAAVHVHGPSYRFPAGGTEADVERAVVEAAARVTNRLRG
jgi:IclR family transcriptional regulator, acetate operon repressor